MIDLTPITQPLLEIAGIVVAGLIPIYVPRALAAFEKRTGIQLTENQRQTVLDAVQTAAGNIETKLDQGVMQISHVSVGNEHVQTEVQALINRVPDAVKALGVTPQSLAAMVVARVDTGSRTAAQAPAKPGGAA